MPNNPLPFPRPIPGSPVEPLNKARCWHYYVTGQASSVAEAAVAFSITPNTAQTWAKHEQWDKQRSDWLASYRQALLRSSMALATPAPLPDSPGQDVRSLAPVLAEWAGLALSCRKPEACLKMAEALQIVALTYRFALTGDWPQSMPGKPGPRPATPAARAPARPPLSERKPLDDLPGVQVGEDSPTPPLFQDDGLPA